MKDFKRGGIGTREDVKRTQHNDRMRSDSNTLNPDEVGKSNVVIRLFSQFPRTPLSEPSAFWPNQRYFNLLGVMFPAASRQSNDDMLNCSTSKSSTENFSNLGKEYPRSGVDANDFAPEGHERNQPSHNTGPRRDYSPRLTFCRWKIYGWLCCLKNADRFPICLRLDAGN